MRWSGQVQPKGAFRLLGPVISWLGTRQEQRIWASLKSTWKPHHSPARDPTPPLALHLSPVLAGG